MASKPAQQVSADEYLERSGVSAYVKDMLVLLLEHRPEDPIEFIVEYLSNALSGGTITQRSYRYIRIHPHERQGFLESVAASYKLLEDKTKMGVTGVELIKLLQMVCYDFPADIVETLLKILAKPSNDVVSFEEFSAGLKVCLMYEEFLEEAETLFHLCDVDGSATVDRTTYLGLLRRMSKLGTNSEDEHRCIMSKAEDLLRVLPPEGPARVSLRDFVHGIVVSFVGSSAVAGGTAGGAGESRA